MLVIWSTPKHKYTVISRSHFTMRSMSIHWSNILKLKCFSFSLLFLIVSLLRKVLQLGLPLNCVDGLLERRSGNSCRIIYLCNRRRLYGRLKPWLIQINSLQNVFYHLKIKSNRFRREENNTQNTLKIYVILISFLKTGVGGQFSLCWN